MKQYLRWFAAVSSAVLLALSSCARLQPAVCGNARCLFTLTPRHPQVLHPVDPRAAVTLVGVRSDGTAILQFPGNGPQVALKPGQSYFNSKISSATLTLDASNPVTGCVDLSEQIIADNFP
jgi:hypothetical protein